MTYEEFEAERNAEYEKNKNKWKKELKNEGKAWDPFRPCVIRDRQGDPCMFLPEDYMELVEHRRLMHGIKPGVADIYE